jgi:hypothetical protein
MKLTSKMLKQIITEELDEGLFDFFSKTKKPKQPPPPIPSGELFVNVRVNFENQSVKMLVSSPVGDKQFEVEDSDGRHYDTMVRALRAAKGIEGNKEDINDAYTSILSILQHQHGLELFDEQGNHLNTRKFRERYEKNIAIDPGIGTPPELFRAKIGTRK